eukprot:comp11071_c0_seq1/m.13774 comp11071_c0_seq1/g.13774  ORF comp11071_c0_seq1/g.13774 comp11071_c0_seq1/m.13774 type:complete len:198 (+) comp11071_c0_seq1:277-870(+)
MIEVKPMIDIHSEDNRTIEMMRQHGIDRVRGAAYVQADLTPEVVATITARIRALDEACFRCGMRGHFAQACPYQANPGAHHNFAAGERHEPNPRFPDRNHRPRPPSPPPNPFQRHDAFRQNQRPQFVQRGCSRCGHDSHTVRDCFADYHISGRWLGGGGGGGGRGGGRYACFRCGRESHFADECYAERDIDGRYIRD